MLMRWMRDINPDMGFDCASEREILEALPLAPPHKIIYAQPCKKLEDIKVAMARGIQTTVVDSVEETEKLGHAGWTGEVLVRLLVRDGGSKQPFSKKFGAPQDWLPEIYKVAAGHKLNMSGFSFHVGSECETPQQYADALKDVSAAAAIAKNYKFDTTKIDIGGGFLPCEHKFEKVAEAIKAGQKMYLPDPALTWIAEPGRFLAAPTHTLYTTVIGKKPVWPPPASDDDPAYRITVDESVYGCFSNIPFDHQTPLLERMRRPQPCEKQRPTIVFGRTCDSGDLIGDRVPLYDVQEGDVLRIENMGAYTTVTASEFNGFPKPQKIYELK